MEIRILIFIIIFFGINYVFYYLKRKKTQKFFKAIENQEYEHFPDISAKTNNYGFLSISFSRRKVDVIFINNHLILFNGSTIIQFSKNQNTYVYHGVTTLMFIHRIYVEGDKLKLTATGPNINSSTLVMELDFAGKHVFLDKIVPRINNEQQTTSNLNFK